MKVSIKLINRQDIKYDITIGDLPQLSFNNKVAVITNDRVAPLHLDTLLADIQADNLTVVTIKDGEEYKNMETIEYILDNLFEARVDRKSTLIAFGGGVIGDMTGFCASLYQRGIEFIQVPTTLLSQVDASVGGKTGVNNRYGKNLIGAFYQPSAVYIEPKFLDTLPSREFGAGVAEIIKMAVMFDKEFFEYLESVDLKDRDKLKMVIKKSVELKATVVNQDEKEAGIRAVLNYGHTFGHVIENETKYKKYLHGEAVAMGMIMANELSVELGLLSRDEANSIEDLLKEYNLPTRYIIKDVDSFYEHFFLDKKSSNNKIKFIISNGGIGTNIIRDDIDETIIKKVLKRFV
ncbi:3-dehydroquinate synthase [hydrothermal vent metagenome]|uniref:3-dehydroquinate synthase n=1 Tax=hydrothermal vent metagenome TaxID=652676 RepID=A0A1W1EI39_9ZZZZ